MPSASQWATFLVASIVLIQVPGPSLLFALGRALTVSLREALTSVVGNGLGVLGQVVLVAVGLGAVVAASATAYTVVKAVGVAYLVWLGVQAIRHRDDARRAMQSGRTEAARPGRALATGFTVGLTNPKTLVFFLAFLPQFTSAGGPAALQILVLGLVFSVLAIASDSLWTLGAGRVRRWFARKPERLDALGATGGALMIGLGVTIAASE